MITFALLEFFSLEQDEGAVSLLEFPAGAFLPNIVKFKCVCRSAGRKRTITSVDKGAVIERLVSEHFNSAELEFVFASLSVADLNVQITDITQGLDLSPTNKLWSRTSTWPSGLSPNSSAEFMTLKHEEQRLKLLEISSAPTHLSTFLYFDNDVNVEEFYNWLISGLAKSIPDVISQKPICGGGGLIRTSMTDAEGCQQVMTASFPMSQNPQKMQFLGKKFILLQPIMIGPIDLCRGLAGALGERAKLFDVVNPTGEPTMGIVRILSAFDKRGESADPEADRLAAPWLA